MTDSTVVNALVHQRDLLAEALGDLLVAMGVVEERGLTGPQLLMAAEAAVEHERGKHMAREIVADSEYGLAKEALAAGLIVTRMERTRCASGRCFNIALWYEDDDGEPHLWASGTHEDVDSVREHIATAPSRRRAEPSPQDLVRELQRAVHGGSYAVDKSPKEVWEDLLDEVRALKARDEAMAEDAPTRMWLNAYKCVRPTEEFLMTTGREVVRMVMEGEGRTETGARVALLRVVAS